MKTREFDIKNYSVETIIDKQLRGEFDEYKLNFKSKIFSSAKYDGKYWNSYPTLDKKDLTKSEENIIIKLAKQQYEDKKVKTVKDYNELRKKCDEIFYDDKVYEKFTPSLNSLFYCQAYTALKDFYDKKMKSKAVSNSRFQARAMSYSKIACD